MPSFINQASLPKDRFAIAFSGGGDSTALVHLFRDCRPKPLVLIVDHGLRSGSQKEAEHAKAFARTLGFESRVLRWVNSGLSTGLQAKARTARYGLMGEQCRRAGIRFLLTAHTRDDQAETIMMRYDRGTDWRGAAGMAQTVYAPLWPQLADVSLVRPLLGTSREALRAYNRDNNLSWLEDPSNQNRNFTRIRARDYLTQRPEQARHLLAAADELRDGLHAETKHFASLAARHISFDPYGIPVVDNILPEGLLKILVRIGSGSGGPIDQTQLTKLRKDMTQPGFNAATLAGAYISAHKGQFRFSRDPVAAKGRANQPPIGQKDLVKGCRQLWDGRYWVTAKRDGLKICPLLSFPEKAENFNPMAFTKHHQTLPVIWDSGGNILAIGPSESETVSVYSAMAPRLHDTLKLGATIHDN